MRLEKMSLVTPNVVIQTMDLAEEEFYLGLEKMRSIEFKENVYNDSSIIFKLSEKDKDKEIRTVEFYMTISEIPDKFPYETVNLLQVDNTILLRQADLEEGLEAARKKIATFALARYGKELEDDTYCVQYNIYNEPLLEVYIPMKP